MAGKAIMFLLDSILYYCGSFAGSKVKQLVLCAERHEKVLLLHTSPHGAAIWDQRKQICE